MQNQLNFNNNYSKCKSNNFFKNKEIKILIPYIETSHYCLYLMLIIAKALQLRGSRVKFLYCEGMLTACERKNIHNKNLNICRDCKLFQRHLLPIFQLDTCELKDFIDYKKIKSINEESKVICKNYPNSYCYYGMDLIPSVNDSILRFYYGGEAKSKYELAIIRAQHLSTAMINLEVAKKIEHVYKPNIILGIMFIYSVWQPYIDYYKKHNIKIKNIRMTPFNYNAIVLNSMENYFYNDRFMSYINSRNEKLLNTNEKKILSKFINERFYGTDQFFRSTKIFNNKIKDKDIADILKINTDKRNIFLFSNLFWDAGLSQTGGLYDNVIEWILSTIDLIKNDNNCHLYIKPHPMEKFGSTESLKGIANYIYDKYPILPSNISIIPPEMKIKTYNLFPYIDLGVLFNGTLGIELLFKNIPVVITGKAPYGGLGLCYEPSTIEDYRNILLGKKDFKIIFNREMLELFCYFYFIKGCIPFDIIKPIYANSNFEKYNINSLEDLLPGKNYYLDHICDCILKDKLPENW